MSIKNTGVLSVSGGATGLTPSTATTGHVTLDGTLAVDHGGTGQTSYTNGQLLIGNSTGNTLSKATLTQGSGVTITNGAGSITISATGTGGDVVGPASATDNAIVRFDGTTGKLIQNSPVTIDDAGNIIGADSLQFSGTPPVTQPIGTLWFDGTTDTLNLQQNNITQQIGEELFIYGRAAENIVDGQVIAVTGSYGTTGVVRFEPAPIGTTNASSIIGIATEAIAKNSFGRITAFGTVHDLNTVAFTDGDVLWYDPTVLGGYTKTQPSAPNIKVQVGVVTKAAGGTNGSIAVRVIPGSTLGGTDSNVQFGTLANNDLIQYSTSLGYWTNNAPSTISVGTATNLAGGAANRIPYQTGAGATSFIAAPTVSNTYLEWSGTVFQWSANPLGTVTSVGLALPTEFTVINSPVTTSGTLTATWKSETANYFFAAPNGSAGTPTFRAMVAADVPTLNQDTTGTAAKADTVKTVSTATNSNYYMTFVDSDNAVAAYEAVYTDAGVTYNPSTNSITSGISGGTF